MKKMLKNLLTPQQAVGYSSQIFLSSTTSIFSLSKFAASCRVLNPNFEMKTHKITEIEREMIVPKHTPDIKSAVSYLASINIETEKTPVEMKREAEEVFYKE